LDTITFDEEKMFLEGTSYIFSDKTIQKNKQPNEFNKLTEYQNQEKAQELNKNSKMEEEPTENQEKIDNPNDPQKDHSE